MKNSRKVAVIGAGMAGLSCGTALQAAGWDVLVLDKSRATGGRMSTRRGDDWQCDHGAQYFTARDPAFHAEVARWQTAGAAGIWRPRLIAIDAEARRPVEGQVTRFVGTPRMTAPARLLAAGLDIATFQTIQRIAPVARGWQLYSKEAGLLDEVFDAVLLSVPAPQAVPLLVGIAPDLADVAGKVRMQPSWAMALQFEAPLGLSFDAAFVNQGPLRWLARDSSKPGREGRETWLLHATAEWSEAHIEESGDTVAAALLAAFVELGGTAPASWSIHRWRYADTDPLPPIGSIWNPALGLGLCGDWLHGGKVEGAWLSGQALARQMTVQTL
ncbi:NAD(P)/FAD-dependent oxidoreductase [Chitinimonas naiadis]